MKSENVYLQIKKTLEEVETNEPHSIIDDDWRMLKSNLNSIEAIDNNKYDELQQSQIDTIKSLLESMNKQFPLQNCIDILEQFNNFVIQRHERRLCAAQST